MTDIPSDSTQWIPAARLLRPQGRRGELLAEVLTDLPGVFVPSRHASLRNPRADTPSSTIDVRIESSWSPTGRNAGRIVLKLAGIDTISAAESVAGQELLVRLCDLPPLEADTWFVRDLIGCELFDGATAVGRISGIEYPLSADGKTRRPDAAPLLEITLHSGDRSNNPAPAPATPHTPHSALVPFVKAWLDSVDLEAKRVIMRLPAGLLDVTE